MNNEPETEAKSASGWPCRPIWGAGRSATLWASFTLAVILWPDLGQAAPSFSFDARAFEKIKEERGVAVYKHRHSKLIRVGAIGRLPGAPTVVQRVLLDYGRQKGRIARVSESRIVERGPNWLLVYQRLNLPVISDRDFVLRVTWGQSGETRWIRYQAVRRGGPGPRDGAVRVTDHVGTWFLRPADGGRSTEARLEVRIDLAGWLPRWLARSGAGKELPGVYSDIAGLLRTHSYVSERRK